MPQFSTHALLSLEREIELEGELMETDPEEIENLYEVQRCADWIRENGFKTVCLQFPDHLLIDSPDVSLKLQNMLQQTVYILGDTAYESCCIDYVAAAHINADAIIHFGTTCFSKSSDGIPHLNIYEKHSLMLAELQSAFVRTIAPLNENFVLLLDDGYIHYYDEVCELFNDQKSVEICTIADELSSLIDKNVIFVSCSERKILNVQLNLKAKSLYVFDQSEMTPGITPVQPESRLLKRRYFLMEKIKDANTMGIVIGTLGVKNYLKMIERVKKLAEVRGKKYYLISVGKPTVSKLANFGEIDVYVMITCSMNEIYDTDEFFKPVVTPWDVEMALNPNAKDLPFTYDYNKYLENLEAIGDPAVCDSEPEVSLLTGKLRSNAPQEQLESSGTESDSQVALKAEGTLALNENFGAGFLQQRSWKGLEPNLGQSEVKLAEKGRTGIAQGYENEKH